MPKRQTKQPTIQQQLIAAVSASTHSQRELAKLADIPQPNLNAFVNGHRGLGLEAVNRLCEVLNLQLTPRN
jgi:plasmid maintenance system antidote protein VapI